MSGSEQHVFCVGDGYTDEALEEWLEKTPPSKTSSPDGWLWLRTPRYKDGVRAEFDGDAEVSKNADVDRATQAFQRAVERAEQIQNDPSIPVRKNKDNKGPTKKQLKDELAQEVTTTLSKLGEQGGWTCGKWLFFVNKEYVDFLWSKLARSVASGPLSRLEAAQCHTIKVAASLQAASEEAKTGDSGVANEKSLICVYFDDCWNKSHAEEVLRCLVGQHGEVPTGCKADLYTLAGIDSKNNLGLRSTLWQVREIMPAEEVEDLRKAWQDANGEGSGGRKLVKAKAATVDDADDEGFESEGDSTEQEPDRKKKKQI
ncbi:unnamed protein product [Parajaminaea phylloscopi]